jgi:8-oxo-dGTP pyrophosphatase MutT (NUDIX family)
MNWKPTTVAVPLHVVQMIAVDPSRRMLLMHRGPNVRSARNVWSFPTGMHDVGESIPQTAVRELHEEYGLRCQGHSVIPLGVYENIAGDPDATEHYHWVINVVAVFVPSLEVAVNKEPEKHDDMQFAPIHLWMDPRALFAKYPFHASFIAWSSINYANIMFELFRLSQMGDVK